MQNKTLRMKARRNLSRIIATMAILLIAAASLCALDGDHPQPDFCPLLVVMAATLIVPLRLPLGGDAIASLVSRHPPLVPARHTPAPI